MVFGKNDLNIFVLVHVTCTGMCDFFYKGTELLMKIMFYYYYDIIGNFMIFY